MRASFIQTSIFQTLSEARAPSTVEFVPFVDSCECESSFENRTLSFSIAPSIIFGYELEDHNEFVEAPRVRNRDSANLSGNWEEAHPVSTKTSVLESTAASAACRHTDLGGKKKSVATVPAGDKFPERGSDRQSGFLVVGDTRGHRQRRSSPDLSSMGTEGIFRDQLVRLLRGYFNESQ
ncbi:uncharacterized protein [Venturia canescens]|uniref:uncharacterized protein n=1 Tax=Venturia canescens TaxID=32260 RepID=UPI001C9C9974|nr:uncharacterized protein LOC122414451 [Venturia canescens]